MQGALFSPLKISAGKGVRGQEGMSLSKALPIRDMII